MAGHPLSLSVPLTASQQDLARPFDGGRTVAKKKKKAAPKKKAAKKARKKK
jgi:hypothetical protein